MRINLNAGLANITTFSVSSIDLSLFDVDWGDGTFSRSFPHTHKYSESGEYTARILGCSALSSTVYEETICVSNAVDPTIEIISNPLSSYTGCGASFEVGVSALDPNITLHFYSSGSDSVPFSEPEQFWDHLNPRWRFLDSSDNNISSVTINGSPIIVDTKTVAYSATYNFKYVDDMPKTPVLFVTLETPNLNSRVYAGITHTVSALEPNGICITGDGIRDIYELQWAGVPIPYVVSFCNTDSDCSTILHYTSGNILSANLTSKCTYLNETISTYTISMEDENCFNTGGYLLTSVTVPSSEVPSVSTVPVLEECQTVGEVTYTSIRLPAVDAKITATAEVTVIGGGTYTLSGESNTFKIYPFEEYHKFRRYGESEDLAEKMNYIAFTDRMRSHPELWNYVDALLGDDLGTIGNKMFFGVDRFQDQHADLDRCNLKSLLDMSAKLDVNVDDYSLDTPSDVERILDMVSMPLEKIVGGRCVCNTNFSQCEACCGSNVCKLCGFDKTSNIGEVITSSEFVTAGEDIIYKEETGDVYEIVHVMAQDGQDVFSIGTLSADCLADRDDLCFYRWEKGVQGNPIESEIDYTSQYTTIDPSLSSAEDWFGDGGVVEEILNYIIIKGLELED